VRNGSLSGMGRLVRWDILCCGTFSDVGRLEMGRLESGTFQELDLLYVHQKTIIK
jgi:hypothetical protein